MENREASKEAMYKWVLAAEERLEEIYSHIQDLPEGGEGWTDKDFAHVAHIMVKCRVLGDSSHHLAGGILDILMEKMRVDSMRN